MQYYYQQEDNESDEEDKEQYVPDYLIGQIFVRDLNGKTLTLDDITTNTTIIEIKHMIHFKKGVPPEDQRLNFGRMMLKDEHSLCYYNIDFSYTLNLSLRLRGGGKRGASKTRRPSFPRTRILLPRKQS